MLAAGCDRTRRKRVVHYHRAALADCARVAALRTIRAGVWLVLTAHCHGRSHSSVVNWAWLGRLIRLREVMAVLVLQNVEIGEPSVNVEVCDPANTSSPQAGHNLTAGIEEPGAGRAFQLNGVRRRGVCAQEAGGCTHAFRSAGRSRSFRHFGQHAGRIGGVTSIVPPGTIHESRLLLLRGRIMRVSDDGVEIAVWWKSFGYAPHCDARYGHTLRPPRGANDGPHRQTAAAPSPNMRVQVSIIRPHMPRAWRRAYIGGATPWLPTTTRPAVSAPLSPRWAMTKTAAPGVRSAGLAVAKVTIGVFVGIDICFFWPPS